MALEWDKFYTLDLDLIVAHWTPIYPEKNIIDRPSCSCGRFESAYHFFFTCLNYNDTRNAYLNNDLHNYSTNDLLHDREQLSEQDNEFLILKVQEFIIKSEKCRKVNRKVQEEPQAEVSANPWHQE